MGEISLNMLVLSPGAGPKISAGDSSILLRLLDFGGMRLKGPVAFLVIVLGCLGVAFGRLLFGVLTAGSDILSGLFPYLSEAALPWSIFLSISLGI